MTRDLLDPEDGELSAAEAHKRAGGLVIGTVGSAVPREIILAAGALPVRISGHPDHPLDLGERYLGPAADAMTKSQLSRLLDGTYGMVDRVVIAQDGEPTVRLFWALRELRRTGERNDLPEIYFFDFSRLPYRTSLLYNRQRLQDLRQTVQRWSGSTIEDDALRAAIVLCNENRRLVAEIERCRHARPSRIMGSEALRILAAGMVLPPGQHNAMVQEFLARADSAACHEGVRIFLTGSGHDHSLAYEAIEGSGAIIVGEDHDWGALFFQTEVDDALPAIDGIIERYQFGIPSATRHTIAERAVQTAMSASAAGADVVVCFTWDDDAIPLWDFPEQKRKVTASGIPCVRLKGQRYASADRASLRDEVRDLIDEMRLEVSR